MEAGTDNLRHLSFRDRLPDRAAVFGVGLVAAAVVSFGIAVVLKVPIAAAFGYTMILFGAVWLLGGGLSGGGYVVYGIGYGVGRNHYMRGDGNRLVSDGLRHGYNRPRANPEAFWQSIGGFLYVAIGFITIVLVS